MNAEKRANTAILQATSEKEKAEKKKSEYNSLIASQKKLTEKRAEELNDQFRIKWQWVMFILIVYSGLATLFTGFKSERVVSDCIGVFNAVRNVIMMIFNWINNISEKNGKLYWCYECCYIDNCCCYIIWHNRIGCIFLWQGGF